MKTQLKRFLCAVICILVAASFAGCQTKQPAVSENTSAAESTAAAGVDIVAKLKALMVTDQALGVAGKYTKLSEIPDGSIDPDVVGTWVSADGKMTYTYSEDGVLKVTSEAYGTNEIPFTCMTIGDYKILCEELELDPAFYDGAKEGDTQLSYTAYSVENDAMFNVVVEEVNEDFTSSVSSLVMMYRADESGSAAAAMAKNPIDLKSLNGTWTSDKGSFIIDNEGLRSGEDSYKLSFNDKNNLVVEKDGKSTAYGMAVAMSKEYDYEDRTKFTLNVTMALSFTGADETDKPNLLPLLEDYKTEFNYETWYYSGSFWLEMQD